ncbi:MAG: hypothetical protein L0241_23610 [Planctomycetia bacterium]|nr:hypothetical protein [Planctomycetia bacterium]
MSAAKSPSGAEVAPAEDYVPPPLPEGIRKSLRVFKAHFPELLKKHPGWWAACDASELLFVGNDWDTIYKKCLKRGLKETEFVVVCLLPDAADSIS